MEEEGGQKSLLQAFKSPGRKGSSGGRDKKMVIPRPLLEKTHLTPLHMKENNKTILSNTLNSGAGWLAQSVRGLVPGMRTGVLIPNSHKVWGPWQVTSNPSSLPRVNWLLC